jgi:DNA-binding response OmpR family regulator
MIKILLIEDNIQLCNSIKDFLELLNYSIDICFDGNTALDSIDKKIYDLYIIDIFIPGVNGLEVLEYIRKKDLNAKIVIMTASLDINDFVKAYDKGCNEYIKKPFHLKELQIRIENLLQNSKDEIVYIDKNIYYNFTYNELVIDNKVEVLRKKLDRLLQILLKNKNHTVKNDDIISYVWENQIKDNYPLRQLVADLRKKLSKDKNYIVSVVGVGYKLEIADIE